MTTTIYGCPYNCGFGQEVIPLEGFHVIVCPQCGNPWVPETAYVPHMVPHRIVGYSIRSNVSEPKLATPCAECGNPVDSDSSFRLCDNCLNSYESKPCEQNSKDVNKSDNVLNRCSKCGLAYEDHGITTGVCPVCFLDEDSVKGNINITDEASTNNLPHGSNEFQILSNNTHVSYRCDGDYVDLRYNGACNTRTSWADIYTLVEEMNESDNISPSIKQLLGEKVGSMNARVACINAFVQAVSEGTISEASAPDKDDADFKPLLKGVIDTRCNYDGGKVGGWL